ncbi:hypothetical protein ACIHBQ_25710 [Streptomyces sp. NPDC052492]|uniref:hypothetical protein n=1 Tax=unclassified Streptomyces TaxID=2593676 RepID=UPI0037D33980
MDRTLSNLATKNEIMTRTVSTDFSFASPVDVSATVDTLIKGGMTPTHDDEVAYLIDEDGLFDWKRSPAHLLTEILVEMDDPRWRDRVVGMTLLFPDSEGITGGDLLFHPDRACLSYIVCVNPKLLPDSRFCDTGWYLRRLVPLLEPLGLTEVETQDSP